MKKHHLLPLLRLASLMILFWAGGVLLAVAQPRGAQRKADAGRIYLIHADRLQQDNAEVFGAQRLNGKVHFRQGAMQLRCDSAVLFNETNTFRAFGHVHMTQGDTVSLRSDSLFYDGNTQIADAYHKVTLTHYQRILTTDRLNYNRMLDIASYNTGGRLKDGATVLTSTIGNYNLGTKEAEFIDDVFLVGKQYDSIRTEHLFYNTTTKWAHAVGNANIFSGVNKIYTEDGYYNTETQEARLLFDTRHRHRPMITYQGKTMQGDSIHHDRAAGLSRAWGNVIIKDPKGKRHLFGDYGQYRDSTNLIPPHSKRPITSQAFVTGKRALIKDFSNSEDTMFVHADTLRLYSYNLKTDSVYRIVRAYPRVRAYRTDVQAVCDSLVYHSQRNQLTLYRDPIVWNNNRQILGEEINLFSNDSTIDSVYVDRQCLLVEQLDTVHYNQVAGEEMRSYFHLGEMRENHVNRNVLVINFPLEKDSTILYQNYTETTKLRMYMEKRRMKRLWTPAAEGTFYAVGMAPPERTRLPNFTWFDYVRPLNKEDVFNYRSKRASEQLKATVRREAPVQHLSKDTDASSPAVSKASPSASEASPVAPAASPSASEASPVAPAASPSASEASPAASLSSQSSTASSSAPLRKEGNR